MVYNGGVVNRLVCLLLVVIFHSKGYESGVGAVAALSFPMRRVASSNLAHRNILNAHVTFLYTHL